MFVIQFTVPQLMNKAMERGDPTALSGDGAECGSLQGYHHGNRNLLSEQSAAESCGAHRRFFRQSRTADLFEQPNRLYSAEFSVTGKLQQSDRADAGCHLAAITGAAPIGIIFAVGNLCGQFFNGIGDAVKAVVSIRSTRPLWEKFELSAVKTEGAEINKPIDEITMQNLSFAYGEKQILTERDFSFVSGGKYAVCGESGSGKTTVMKLLLGLLPRYEGRICYDGIEQRQADVSSLYGADRLCRSAGLSVSGQSAV